MTISAKVIADSLSPDNVRLTTLQLRYPRFVHAEWLTHRAFSRNASSSRAIPVERLIRDMMEDPAMPVFWGKNRPGMQAVEEMNEEERSRAVHTWLDARRSAATWARELYELGAHKQIVNRVIEPFCHINVVCSATEWENFFALRCHPDAQPELQAVANAMRAALAASVPTIIDPGRWHLPYVNKNERSLDGDTLVKVSVARCARVSYLTHEGRHPLLEDDLKLYDRLVGSDPKHLSPSEHVAQPDSRLGTSCWRQPYLHANFVGWIQHRQVLDRPDLARFLPSMELSHAG